MPLFEFPCCAFYLWSDFVELGQAPYQSIPQSPSISLPLPLLVCLPLNLIRADERIESSLIRGNLRAYSTSLHSLAKHICLHTQLLLRPPGRQLPQHYTHCTVNWFYSEFLTGF